MKFIAKHPDGAAYALTREELQAPHLVQQLSINESWRVQVGEEWMPLAAFLALSVSQLRERVSRPTDVHLAATARWTPGSAFGLALRLFGLYLLLQVFQGMVTLFSGLVVTPLSRVWVSVLLSNACFLVVGLYLLLKPHAIVAWVFKDDGVGKEDENSKSGS